MNLSILRCSSFLLFTVFILYSSPSVRSDDDSSLLQLPTDVDGGFNANPCLGMEMPESCPSKCFRTDPVCGVDGVTYWCGCADALCSGTAVAKLGFCDVGSGSSTPLSGQALLLVHIIWLIVLGISVLFGLF